MQHFIALHIHSKSDLQSLYCACSQGLGSTWAVGPLGNPQKRQSCCASMRWLCHVCIINKMLAKSVGLTMRAHAVLWLPPGCIQPAYRAAWAEHLTCHSSQTAWNTNKCANFSTAAQTMLLGWKRECAEETQLFGSLKSKKSKFMKVSLKLTVFSWMLAPATLSSPWEKWPFTSICTIQTPSQAVKEPLSFLAWVTFLKNVILWSRWRDWQPLHSKQYPQHSWRALNTYKLRMISRLIPMWNTWLEDLGTCVLACPKWCTLPKVTVDLWSRTGVSQATDFEVPTRMQLVTHDFLVKSTNTGIVIQVFSGTLCFPVCSLLHGGTQPSAPRAAACSIEQWDTIWDFHKVSDIVSPVCVKLFSG